ncbi:hypothetical protein [Pseudonocardia oroxyli]|uniref:Transcriptional regulator, AbiEi antitoxin, Type IV TA system n=1 Tax=Pseudonocardia oroxyli TaxID=366584 RepID=A0A1G7EUH1_PSEOR|nr:hypothetical protein [Pseudonocardia oroxyli]SDE67343.1 Transcriptional regulator, AbiEi antitoxin, Type IV TA system [Pseudonocardia oroxyli]
MTAVIGTGDVSSDPARLLARQHGIVSLAQARTLGYSWSAVVAQVAAARWQRVLPRVYAVFTGPLPAAARIVAALLYGGPSAILSHRTAAEIWGMLRPEAGPVHITVPYGASAVSQELVVVHRSRAHRHIRVATDPPRTSRADTALDLAVAEPDGDAARRMLVAALTSGRVAPGTVEKRMTERPPMRHRKAIRAGIALVRDGVQSALEERYAVDVERAHEIPPGRRQSPFVVDGTELYEDVVYDGIGVPLTVRLDGRTHLVDGTAFRDRRRDNAGELAGRARLVYGWRDLDADPCAAAREVASVLRREGWAGHLVPCPRCS